MWLVTCNVYGHLDYCSTSGIVRDNAKRANRRCRITLELFYYNVTVVV